MQPLLIGSLNNAPLYSGVPLRLPSLEVYGALNYSQRANTHEGNIIVTQLLLRILFPL